jgi:hypothetical protein
LAGLDVSNDFSLTGLRCGGNILTILDVSKNSRLFSLDCYGNNLADLDVTNYPSLYYLVYDDNPSGSLDLSKNNYLGMLACENNNLTDLDVSNNSLLTLLACGNNKISNLDLSNNRHLRELYLTFMETLFEVCIWILPSSERQGYLDTTGSPNVYFTNECGSNIVTIPDTAFLYALIDEGVDTDGDSLICYGEAEVIQNLDVSDRGITEMTGIEAFANLRTLNVCNNNFLTSINIGEMETLDTLNVSDSVEIKDMGNSYEKVSCGSTGSNHTNFHQPELLIYPNPFSTCVSIELAHNMAVNKIELLDIMDKVVRIIEHNTGSKITIHRENLPPECISSGSFQIKPAQRK